MTTPRHAAMSHTHYKAATLAVIGAMLLALFAAVPANAATISLTDCLHKYDPLGAYNESVVATFPGAFVLKCGRKDPDGYGVRHINEAHPVTNDLIPCMADVLKYGLDSAANSPNRKHVVDVSGFEGTVVYLPGSPPSSNSVVTAFTNGSPTNQWTLCKNIIV